MNDKIILHTSRIGGHPVEPFLAKSAQHCMDMKYTEKLLYPGWDHEALYMIDNPHSDEGNSNTIYSAISFTRSQHTRALNVQWSYTKPSFRGRGYFTSVFRQLTGMAADWGYTSIIRTVHAANADMIKAIEAQGGKLKMYEYEVRLPVDRLTVRDPVRVP